MSGSTSTEVSKRGGKAKKRKEAQDVPPEKDVATKQEYEIARWMRKNVPMKKTKFLSHTVEYFTACKAVDLLMDSPWTQPAKVGEDPLFSTRESIVSYLDVMLRHKLFHRARKIVVPESELKSKKKKQADKDKDKDKDGKNTGDKDKDKEESSPSTTALSKKEKKQLELQEKETTAAESSHAEQEKDSEKSDKKKKKKDEGDKKKRKVRLDMHLEQRFVDGLDAYVWIYEPTPFYYYFFGFLVVVGVIAVCLFPLWPPSVRQGVYYLSVAAAGFLVFILALAVLRVVVFGIIWCVTFGNHHVWLLPNLTEDVGFFQSFWPLMKYEYKGTPKDNEDEEVEIVEIEEIIDDEEADAIESRKEAENSKVQRQESSDKNDSEPHSTPNNKTGSGSNSNSETESEGSHPSQLGKDFEMVEKSEVEESEVDVSR